MPIEPFSAVTCSNMRNLKINDTVTLTNGEVVNILGFGFTKEDHASVTCLITVDDKGNIGKVHIPTL